MWSLYHGIAEPLMFRFHSAGGFQLPQQAAGVGNAAPVPAAPPAPPGMAWQDVPRIEGKQRLPGDQRHPLCTDYSACLSSLSGPFPVVHATNPIVHAIKVDFKCGM